MRYICELCGWVYDEETGDIAHGIQPGTKFEDVPEDYECPGCYSEKNAFNRVRAKQETP